MELPRRTELAMGTVNDRSSVHRQRMSAPLNCRLVQQNRAAADLGGNASHHFLGALEIGDRADMATMVTASGKVVLPFRGKAYRRPFSVDRIADYAHPYRSLDIDTVTLTAQRAPHAPL